MIDKLKKINLDDPLTPFSLDKKENNWTPFCLDSKDNQFIEQILDLAFATRNTLIDWSAQHKSFSFPLNSCKRASFMLRDALANYGISSKVLHNEISIGEHFLDRTPHYNLLVEGMYYVDITGDQFNIHLRQKPGMQIPPFYISNQQIPILKQS